VIYGNPEVTTGGRALKFYSSMRIDVRRIETLKQGDQMIGNRTRAKIVKNKVAPPFKTAEFDIMYGHGISKEGDVLDCSAAENFIEKAGSWYSYDGERIGQGRENAKQFLRDNPDILDKLEGQLLDKLQKDEPEEEEKAPKVKTDEDGVVIEEK
jgi:recombination protein RecA